MTVLESSIVALWVPISFWQRVRLLFGVRMTLQVQRLPALTVTVFMFSKDKPDVVCSYRSML